MNSSRAFPFGILQKEEIEWMGLTLKEARKKQRELEMAAAEAAVRPFKQIYTEDLISRMKGGSIFLVDHFFILSFLK